MEFLVVFGIIGGIVLLSIIMINIRHIVTGEEFRGSCASNNPMIKNNMGDCTVCGKTADEACKMPELKDATA